jgi:hypothetical protein
MIFEFWNLGVLNGCFAFFHEVFCSDISILHHLDCDLKILIYDMIGNISGCFFWSEFYLGVY